VREGRLHDGAIRIFACHFICPVDETQSIDYWLHVDNFATDDATKVRMNEQFALAFDEDGNCLGANFTEYLLPSSKETPHFELYETETPSPHHPIGAKGVGESATVGSPAAGGAAGAAAAAPPPRAPRRAAGGGAGAWRSRA
jgi:hypothetical protein